MAGSMDVIEFVAREALTNEDKFKRLVAQLGDFVASQSAECRRIAGVYREG